MTSKKLAPVDDRIVQPLGWEEMNRPRDVDDTRERAKIHRILLTETLRRLRAGRTLERSHGVIHPELTCIIRDALRLASLVFPAGAEAERKKIEEETEIVEVPQTVAMAALEALVSQGGAARVAKVGGVSPKELSAMRAGAKPAADVRQGLAARLRIPVTAWEEPAA